MTSEYYFVDDKHTNDLYQPTFDEFKCCKTPFPVYNSRTMSNRCNCCNTWYKLVTENVYTCEDCKNVDIPVTVKPNLLKDDRTDWVNCKNCQKLLNYTTKTSFDVIEAKKAEKVDRFLIVGKALSGKSTLASKLGKQTGLPIYEDNASNQPIFNEEITKGIIMSKNFPEKVFEDVIVLKHIGDYDFKCNSVVDDSTKRLLTETGVKF